VARRRAAYQKRKQNKFAMMLVTLVLLMLIVVVNIRKGELREKQAVYAARQEADAPRVPPKRIARARAPAPRRARMGILIGSPPKRPGRPRAGRRRARRD